MQNTKIFQNTWPLYQLPATMKLANLEWRFLLCTDGKTTAGQIQRRLGISDAEREQVIARLLDSNLLTEVTLTIEDYAKTTVDTPSTSTEPQTFAEYLNTSAAASSEKSPATEKAPAAEKSAPTFSPLQKPTNTARAMSLRSVIQFILNQNSDPTTGHLATYQVFMGINTQLLKRNGITSLRFQDDRLITDPELQTAIAENIKKVLGKSCPEDVFSAAPAEK
jgi:hypothetical protein